MCTFKRLEIIGSIRHEFSLKSAFQIEQGHDSVSSKRGSLYRMNEAATYSLHYVLPIRGKCSMIVDVEKVISNTRNSLCGKLDWKFRLGSCSIYKPLCAYRC